MNKKQAPIKISQLTATAPKGLEKKDIKKETEKMAKEIGELITKMYANKKYSLLVCLLYTSPSPRDRG